MQILGHKNVRKMQKMQFSGAEARRDICEHRTCERKKRDLETSRLGDLDEPGSRYHGTPEYRRGGYAGTRDSRLMSRAQDKKMSKYNLDEIDEE